MSRKGRAGRKETEERGVAGQPAEMGGSGEEGIDWG